MSDTPETKPAAIIVKLREYNEWRRGSDHFPIPDPIKVGLYIDEVCDIAERLECERDEANVARKSSAADWLNQVANMAKCVAASKKRAVRAEKERDEARDLADAAMWEADRIYCQLWKQEGGSTLTESKRSYWPVKNAQSSKRDCYKSNVEVITKERDEAREKITRQAARIRELEGATNHAGGTSLTIAMRERDEAIQERERWKMQAEQKWGMRRELEELLGVKGTEQEEQFAKGVAVLHDLVRDAHRRGEAP